MIKKIVISDVVSFRNDPAVAAFLVDAAKELGVHGRFVVRLSGIPQECRVLAEGTSEEACIRCIDGFIELLVKRGYYGS